MEHFSSYRGMTRDCEIYMSNTQIIMIRKFDASKYTNFEGFYETTFSAKTISIGENTIKKHSYSYLSNTN
ncbi:hypothetical protein H8356DRAFT_1661295 [Neocallimastix lanati (nom. inval.)]|nr:hypothetical protein H8356DRAFT_1661295 [Neocallimastix sp. JGI-2020a]